MISKLFRRDQNKRENGTTPADLKNLRAMTASKNITSVSVPRYRVRGSFVEYVIECTKQNASWQVFRRYQQFKALDQSLKQLCQMGSPNHCDYGVLPVLAGSHWTEVTNHSVDLVEKRRRYLEIYLAQLLVPMNLFYVAKTALYNFLHDGEIPVCHRMDIIRPLNGFTAPETLVTELCEETQTESQNLQQPSPLLQQQQEQQQQQQQQQQQESVQGEQNKQRCNSGGNPPDNQCTPTSCAHVDSRRSTEKSENNFVVSTAPDDATVTSGTKDSAGEDLPSNEDTDTEDLRLPSRLPYCQQCNAEFSSVLYAHRCFSCKQRFCRNCLRRLLLDGDTFKACVQCYENENRKLCSSNNATRSTPVATETTLGVPSIAPHSTTPSGKDVSSSLLPLPLSENDRKNAISSPVGPLKLNASHVRTDVSLNDFQLVTTIGHGSFGKVMKVIYRTDGKVYAMKVLNKCIIHKRRMVEYIKEEKNILSMLPVHPYIVTCHFAFQTDYHLFFVLDYLHGGELFSLVYPKCTLGSSDIRLYIAEVVLALEHLHSYDIVHRDVKPENIVLGSDGHLKLTDFGLARMNFSRYRRRSFVGSAEYLPPETIQGDYQTKAVDWWSLGVMLYEMLRGVPPFHAANNNDVYNNVLNRPLDLSAPCFSPEAASLIQQLLQRSVKTRLSDASRIKEHPYFASINWSALKNKAIPAPFQPILDGNDTRCFKREFTTEWAVIPQPLGVSRATLEVLTRRFSNFTLVSGEVVGPRGISTEKPVTAPATDIKCFMGVWRVLKVEMVTTDGHVAYPWGGAVSGLLMYLPGGLYTMQFAIDKRRKLRSESFLQASKEELGELCSSYVANFGKFSLNATRNYLVHTPTASLYPNLSNVSQKLYFEFHETDGLKEGGRVRLKLSTALTLIRDENLSARTVITWEKVASSS